ncbi:MAG: hypothetical protein JW779_15735, partial [Candidatus Thorarchaeota archaeon]|nr:hypothetical protein [Candidatus Thorarchaeota archaeon]
SMNGNFCEGTVVYHQLPRNVLYALNEMGFDPEAYRVSMGNQLQQLNHLQLMQLVANVSDLRYQHRDNAFIQETTGLLLINTEYARQYNAAGKVEKATYITNLCKNARQAILWLNNKSQELFNHTLEKWGLQLSPYAQHIMEDQEAIAQGSQLGLIDAAERVAHTMTHPKEALEHLGGLLKSALRISAAQSQLEMDLRLGRDYETSLQAYEAELQPLHATLQSLNTFATEVFPNLSTEEQARVLSSLFWEGYMTGKVMNAVGATTEMAVDGFSKVIQPALPQIVRSAAAMQRFQNVETLIYYLQTEQGGFLVWTSRYKQLRTIGDDIRMFMRSIGRSEQALLTLKKTVEQSRDSSMILNGQEYHFDYEHVLDPDIGVRMNKSGRITKEFYTGGHTWKTTEALEQAGKIQILNKKVHPNGIVEFKVKWAGGEE